MRSIHDKDAKKTADIYGRDPNSVVIVGFDPDSGGPEHSLYDAASNREETTEVGVKYAYEYGIPDPIFLVRDGGRVLVLKGRKKTRDLREANRRRVADGLPPHLLPTITVKGSHEAPGMRRASRLENWGLRRDIPTSVIAKEANELLEHNEVSEELLCELLRIKKGQLKNYLAIPSLGARATAALDDGRLKLTAALPLTKMSVADQNAALEKVLAPGAKKPTFDRVRAAAGKAPIQTPKVRLGMAVEILAAIDETKADRATLEDAVRQLKAIVAKPVKPEPAAGDVASKGGREQLNLVEDAD